ncbi:hypothetical protein CGI23_24955 [Vibrio parahaemolyticus]|uniref:hybrid sensor histidine kinase/response regulator n=1 Tax=Vibrio parahaemolyticus TaxID=670 RepID=UPI0011226C45|nr:hybrid sensor histidine kinase/response regulator [Vibrio parahaemolyticus]TOK17900.1 hypothetical protein CGI23_24955 [Vibrio parahaemolyticus]
MILKRDISIKTLLDGYIVLGAILLFIVNTLFLISINHKVKIEDYNQLQLSLVNAELKISEYMYKIKRDLYNINKREQNDFLNGEIRDISISLANQLQKSMKLDKGDYEHAISFFDRRWSNINYILQNPKSKMKINSSIYNDDTQVDAYLEKYYLKINKEIKRVENALYLINVILSVVFLLFLIGGILFFQTLRSCLILPLIKVSFLSKKSDFYQTKIKNISTPFKEVNYLFNEISNSAMTNIEAKYKLKKSLEEKSNFLTIISHEMRTPLNVILGNIELMYMKTFPKDALLLDILSSSQSLKEIIDMNLSLKKLENIGQNIKKEVRLSEIVNDVCINIKPLLRNSNVVVEFYYGLNIPMAFSLDKQKLLQCIVNIISNAIKSSKNKGVVRVRLTTDIEQVIKISIFDNGVGMKKNNIPLLMKKYKQDKVSSSGVGLGTYIISQLVEIMGGTINLVSRYNVGTLFVLRIPYKANNGIDMFSDVIKGKVSFDQYTSRCFYQGTSKNKSMSKDVQIFNCLEVKNKSGGANEAKEIAHTYPDLNILLVEDFALNVKLFLRIADILQLNTTIARNGSEALETVELSSSYDVIFMDIQLPDTDGFEVTRQLRRAGCRAFIIGLSAYKKEKITSSCYQSGMNSFLQKPFSLNALNHELTKARKYKEQALC